MNDIPLSPRQALRLYGLRPKKELGQHFLVDRRVLKKIVKAAEISSQDIVVEVGPGLGILTQALVKEAGKVIAVEIDPQLVSFLKNTFSSFSNIEIIQGDILKINLGELIGSFPYKVVANIPYYITSPIIRYFLEAEVKPRLMVIMVQREVAETITAKPGEMSFLSVFVQLYSRPKVIDYISPKSFHPPPKVESAILRLDVLEHPLIDVDKDFFVLLEAGFSAPRKQLHNSLALGLNMKPQEVAMKLKSLGIEPKRRPQTLNLEEWAKIWKAFKI